MEAADCEISEQIERKSKPRTAHTNSRQSCVQYCMCYVHTGRPGGFIWMNKPKNSLGLGLWLGLGLGLGLVVYLNTK